MAAITRIGTTVMANIRMDETVLRLGFTRGDRPLPLRKNLSDP